MTRCRNFFLAGVFLFLASAGAHAAVFSPGEMIRYAIKQSGVKVGEATLEFQGETYRDGKKYTLIVFTAKGFNFFDEERIFVDGQTFLPQRVMRDLNIFGKKEQIMEDYDQAAGTVRITKIANGVTTEQLLQKGGTVDNIYGFIYRYRAQDKARQDVRFALRLPTMNVTMSLVKSTTLNAAGKVYQASLMRSVPSKYSIWMDKGEGCIPLRIVGAVGIANTAMTMIAYREAFEK